MKTRTSCSSRWSGLLTGVALAVSAPSQCLAVLTNVPAMVLAQGNTRFAVDLYQRVRNEGDNVFFSPYSISTALGMTYAGARGLTATEMARVLHFTMAQDQLPAAFGALAAQLEAVQAKKQIRLSIANSLWAHKHSRFLDEFLNLCRQHYRAAARQVDFVSQSESTRREINSWVEDKTQDKIKNLIRQGDLTPLTRLVLCNAIYFKGNWTRQFNSKATQPAPFFLAPDRSVQAPMMHQKAQFKAVELEGFSLVELDYAGGEVSMVLLLPQAVDGLPALEQRLSGDTLPQWLTQLQASPAREADLYLPRFKTNCRLQLARTLAQMGMPLAFSPEADLSGMDGSKTLSIDKVIHQAFVDVNEEGTEAAAATAVTMKRTAILRTPVYRADHPFLFLIREKQTGSILFVGRLADPTR